VKVDANFVKPIQIRRHTVFTRIQDQVFSINFVLKYVSSSEIHIRNQPHHAAQNEIALNRISDSKACMCFVTSV